MAQGAKDFVDASGAPLPGPSFLGSPQSDESIVSNMTDIINGSDFAWEINNVNVSRSNGDEDGEGDNVPDEKAEDNARGAASTQVPLTAEMASEMFRDMTSFFKFI